MKRDFVCLEFDRLRDEIATWHHPDKPKPKDPIRIDLDAPMRLSAEALSLTLKSKPEEPRDV